MTEVDPDEAFTQGRALFDGFVRGDAMIGLIADVPGTERAMLDALWTAAQGRMFLLLVLLYLCPWRGTWRGFPQPPTGR